MAEIAAVRLSNEDFTAPLHAIDVGCDHAKLSISLVRDYGFAHVTASDIHEGPCARAAENVAAAGLSDQIDVVRTDGLTGLSQTVCERVILAGMGGELIRDILAPASFLREKKRAVKFVLQPQTKAHLLRDYLFRNGYEILDERWVKDAGKCYCVLAAVYDGLPRTADLYTLYFGAFGGVPGHGTDAFAEAFERKYRILRRVLAQRTASGAAPSARDAEEAALFHEMTQRRKAEKETP